VARLLYWDDWNEPHVAEHNVVREEADYVVDHASGPFPRHHGDGKYLVRGQTADGRYLQVIFVYRPSNSVDIRFLDERQRLLLESVTKVTYVIHARDLTGREKHQLLRRSL
jgi:hypothetical protein